MCKKRPVDPIANAEYIASSTSKYNHQLGFITRIRLDNCCCFFGKNTKSSDIKKRLYYCLCYKQILCYDIDIETVVRLKKPLY